MTRFEPLVLCYHAVSTSWRHDLAVTPDAFAAQVGALLRRGYRPATAAEVLPGRGRLLHVTFDDAFRSIVPALEALRRLGVPATVFVCSGLADTGAPLEVPELADEPLDERATLRWDELRALAGDGVAVGAHTVSHPRLTTLGDAELARELAESRARVEDELGGGATLLAYPYGDEDGRVQAAARDAGFAGAFALPGDERAWTPFRVPRVGAYPADTPLRFRLKTTTAARLPAAALRRLFAR